MVPSLSPERRKSPRYPIILLPTPKAYPISLAVPESTSGPSRQPRTQSQESRAARFLSPIVRLSLLHSAARRDGSLMDSTLAISFGLVRSHGSTGSHFSPTRRSFKILLNSPTPSSNLLVRCE